jgi:hypothetical protein
MDGASGNAAGLGKHERLGPRRGGKAAPPKAGRFVESDLVAEESVIVPQ